MGDISTVIRDVKDFHTDGVVGIAFDVETTGGSMSENAMVELGAVAMAIDDTKNVTVLATFEGHMKIPEGRGWEKRCVEEFWNVEKPDEKQRVVDCQTEPEDVMRAFTDWVFGVRDRYAGGEPTNGEQRVRFLSDAAYFDAGWVAMYLAMYAKHFPLHTFFSKSGKSCFRPVLDTNAFFRGIVGTTLNDELEAERGPDKWSVEKAVRNFLDVPEDDKVDVEHDHRAVHDAESIMKKYMLVLRNYAKKYDGMPELLDADTDMPGLVHDVPKVPTELPKAPVNLMPHDCVVYAQNKKDVLHTVPRSGNVLRLLPAELVRKVHIKMDSDSDTLVTCAVGPPGYEGLDGEVPDSAVIVSDLVARHLKEMDFAHPVFVPDTNPGCAVRNDKGAIIGTTQLRLYSW
jgi:DNA polymerase III epsilon subunit-like protein